MIAIFVVRPIDESSFSSLESSGSRLVNRGLRSNGIIRGGSAPVVQSKSVSNQHIYDNYSTALTRDYF